MDNEELLKLQDDAYRNILEQIIEEDDPEKLQQLANAASQLEKGRNDFKKISNEGELNLKKFEHDEENRKEELKVADKQRKFDWRLRIFEGVVTIASLATGIGLAFRTKEEEENSYVKNPKTDMEAKRFLDRAFKRNK